MLYSVTFYQTVTFDVEANSEDEAIEKALPEFDEYVRRPVARTDYDSIEVAEQPEYRVSPN